LEFLSRAEPTPRGGTETILLVEDDPTVRLTTRAVLERHGYRVLEAVNGVEALKVWEERRAEIELLLTDLVMPEGLTGQKLAARIQQTAPAPRVVFVSAIVRRFPGAKWNCGRVKTFSKSPSPWTSSSKPSGAPWTSGRIA